MAQRAARVLTAIGEVAEEAWDALRDVRATPFTRHAFLSALESSGCASPASGWTPRHLALFRGRDLVAAAPAWIREDSDGDFSRDWDWASAAARARLPYYPKLSIAVPFTPVTGRRFLVAPGEDFAACAEALLSRARKLCEDEGISSIQVLFPQAEEARALEPLGLATRVSFQFHWRNEGYRTMDDFLARFTSKRRNMLRREMRAAAEQGIFIRTVRGEELSRAPRRFAELAHALHRSTVDKLMWGRRWLDANFYRAIFRDMPEDLELVVAEREGRPIAGAFNVATPERLYGRYWGALEDHPFLHFNVCYYHSIAECIARGVQVFEGGAGGEHKLPRGFLPAETWSAHWARDARLDRALRDSLREETPAREASIARFLEDSPVFRKAAP